jgi:hypothetical protein
MLKELENCAMFIRNIKDLDRAKSDLPLRDQLLHSFKMHIYTILSRFIPTCPYPDEWESVRIEPTLVFAEASRWPNSIGELIFKTKIEDLELYCGYMGFRRAFFVKGWCPRCGQIFGEVNIENVEDLYDKVTQATKQPPDWHKNVCPISQVSEEPRVVP